MLKRSITYVDFNGTERTEDYFFHLSRAEIAEMELTTDGGLEAKIQRIVDSQNGGEIIGFFKELLLMAYGEKSDDGRHFTKSKELSLAFTHTPAYDTLFMELATDADAAAAFVNGIVPEELLDILPPDVTTNKPI